MKTAVYILSRWYSILVTLNQVIPQALERENRYILEYINEITPSNNLNARQKGKLPTVIQHPFKMLSLLTSSGLTSHLAAVMFRLSTSRIVIKRCNKKTCQNTSIHPLLMVKAFNQRGEQKCAGWQHTLKEKKCIYETVNQSCY